MKKKDTLKMHGIGMLVLLTLQYLLGMFTNMFVQFPDTKQEGALWEFAWKQFPLAAHIIIGFLLIIGAFALITTSIKQRNKPWIIASIIGYIGIQTAASAGSLFIPSQQNLYSYVMAVAFIIAFISYGWGVYSSRV